MNAPANAVGTDAQIRSIASLRFGFPSRQCTAAPTDLLTDAATRSLATATVGLMPRKISAGVIRAPPPIPVKPTTMPIPKLTSRTARALVVKRSDTVHPFSGGIGHARLVERRSGGCRFSHARRQVAGVVEIGEYVVQGVVDRAPCGVHPHRRVLRLLVGRGDAGELGDLAAARLGV